MGNGHLHEEEGAVHCYVHQTCSVLHYDNSKRCVCPLYKFVYSFKVVKLFLKHPIFTSDEKMKLVEYMLRDKDFRDKLLEEQN
jgi:hypothetical protein